MIDKLFTISLLVVAVVFSYFFITLAIPSLLENPDIGAAFAAGFVNPFASLYSIDATLCWAILAILIIYDRYNYKVKYGWGCLLLGMVPGVAVGLSLYLIMRHKQLTVREVVQ